MSGSSLFCLLVEKFVYVFYRIYSASEPREDGLEGGVNFILYKRVLTQGNEFWDRKL